MRFITYGRSRALETGVGTSVAAGPEIVPFCELGISRRADWLAPEFGDYAGEIGDFQQDRYKLGMGRGHLGSERAVGGVQSRYRGTIAGSGRGKIGDCVDYVLLVGVVCVLLIGVVGGLETSAGSGDLSVTSFEVGCCKVYLEVFPGLVGQRLPLPGLTVVKKEACLKKELEGNINHLLVGIGIIPCCCILDGSFDLVE